MPLIHLMQNQAATVDEQDHAALAAHDWYALWSESTKTFYAVRNAPHPEKLGTTLVQMHRVILGLNFGDPRLVDHIDKDTLNNRRANLRIVTPRQNGENRRDQSKHGVGVYYEARMAPKPYKAMVRVRGRNKHLGYFSTAEEARQARQTFLSERGECPL